MSGRGVLGFVEPVTAPDRASATEAAVRDELRACGLRATPARIGVLITLRGMSRAVSHAELSERLEQEEKWDRATVFRCLTALVEAGLVEMTIPDKPRSIKQQYRLTEAGKKYLDNLDHD